MVGAPWRHNRQAPLRHGNASHGCTNRPRAHRQPEAAELVQGSGAGWARAAPGWPPAVAGWPQVAAGSPQQQVGVG